MKNGFIRGVFFFIAVSAPVNGQTLDQKCSSLANDQINLKTAAQTLPALPKDVVLTRDVQPTNVEFPDAKGISLDIPILSAGSIIKPIGLKDGKFIVEVRARKTDVETTGIAWGSLGSSNASFVKTERKINGTGLVDISCTDFQHRLYTSLTEPNYVKTVTSTALPLMSNGKKIGEMPVPVGTRLSVISHDSSTLKVAKDESGFAFDIPKSSTNWDESIGLMGAMHKLYGFISRLNQILSEMDLKLDYTPSNPKRFKIQSRSENTPYWEFNPEDLSANKPILTSQEKSITGSETIEYSKIRAIGLYHGRSAAIYADKESLQKSNTITVDLTVYYVIVSTFRNADLLSTSEPGDVVKRKLVFRITDKSKAMELADLFQDFCGQFSGHESDKLVERNENPETQKAPATAEIKSVGQINAELQSNESTTETTVDSQEKSKIGTTEAILLDLSKKYNLTRIPINVYTTYSSESYTLEYVCRNFGRYIDDKEYDNYSLASNSAKLELVGYDTDWKSGKLVFMATRHVYSPLNGEYLGAKMALKCEIEVRDIPFILFCYNKCHVLEEMAKGKNISGGVEKQLGESDSGRIKASFIVGGRLKLIIDSKELTCDDPSISGNDLFDAIETVSFQIDVARKSYQELLQYKKEQKKAEEKRKRDQANVDELLK